MADTPVKLLKTLVIPGYLCASKLADLKKIRVAAVSYLNTKPMLYGIRHHEVLQEMELVEDYPAKIAQMLIDDQVDVGLIPVAATLKLADWHVVGDYCIGADGAVASVCIFSEVPMEAIETVLLDYQSRTSVNLARVLLKEFWKKDVMLIYRVASLDNASAELRSKGWHEENRIEIPPGPCSTFRDPAGNTVRINQQQ